LEVGPWRHRFAVGQPAGTMVQEVYETNPAIREACEASILGHVAKLEADVAAAIELHPLA
jgi:TetR/AcrR family transcriptional regulator, transcriptional repressor for nem operon